jgi:NAD+ kinase
VHKGVEINLIRLQVSVDAHSAGEFDADGVIVSTPTGSTGYGLSLGGPIVHPDVRALVFMPLNPHSLFNRPVVLPEQSRVTIRLPSAAAILTCDGQQAAMLEPGSQVQISAPGLEVELVQFDGGRNFFQLLRQKLRWGLPLTDGEQ